MTPPTEACAPGEWHREDGACIAAGLSPDLPCPPGQAMHNGACVDAGVPPDGCGTGFEHDGDRGCEPILPAEPCPMGLMAVPGDASCREIAPCGNPPWGNIAVEPSTQFVDGSYTGMDSDGSADKPWTTVQAGVDAAAPEAIVAVAAGDYAESVAISGKAVRLWGRCPSLVEISATGYGAVFVDSGASGSEVRGLALIGSASGAGLLVSNAQDVVAEALWIHDSPSFGVSTEAFPNDTSLTLGGSLIERNRDVGVFVWSSGSTLVVEASVVRDTLPVQGTFGRGISVECTPSLGCDASVTSHASVRGSLIEGNRDIGINVSGAEAEIVETVVRGTLPAENGLGGWGVQFQVPCWPPGMCDGSAPARGTLRQSLIDQNHASGVTIGGSEAHIEATVVRGTLPDEQGRPGRGVTLNICYPPWGCAIRAPAVATLRWSLIEDNHDIGLIVTGSQVEIEASAVRGTLVNAAGRGGIGMSVQPICDDACDPTTPSRAEIRSSLFEANHTVALSVAGSELTLEASVVQGTRADAQGNWGRGMSVRAPCAVAGCLAEMPAVATLSNVLIEDNMDSGVAIANAQATLQSCVIRGTKADANARFGDGLAVYGELAPASASVTATIVESSARGALSAFGATLRYAGTALRDQSFDLIGERIGQSGYVIENLGGNCCDCPAATEECIVESAGFEPPAPLTDVPATSSP